jgi:hypothetical protein
MDTKSTAVGRSTNNSMEQDIATAHASAGSAVGSSAEEIIFRLLIQIVIILLVSRLFVFAAKKFLRQTPVGGEILAGIALGPSTAFNTRERPRSRSALRRSTTSPAG